MKDKKIKLFADGLKIDQFDIDFGVEVDGYTFNPSIFKNHGAKDYLNYSKEGVLNLYFTAGERDFSKSQIQFDKPSFIVFVRPPRPLISSEGIFLALKQESFQRTPLDGLKTMAYLKNIYEKKLADPCDDVLLYDNNQSVLETSQSNVFFVKGNELLTPKSNCLLAGIMRQFIIDHQADLSINVHQQPIHIDELSSFDEIFLTNSVQQIQLVRSVKHYPELRSNHFSRLLQQKVMERLQDGS